MDPFGKGMGYPVPSVEAELVTISQPPRPLQRRRGYVVRAALRPSRDRRGKASDAEMMVKSCLSV